MIDVGGKSDLTALVSTDIYRLKKMLVEHLGYLCVSFINWLLWRLTALSIPTLFVIAVALIAEAVHRWVSPYFPNWVRIFGYLFFAFYALPTLGSQQWFQKIVFPQSLWKRDHSAWDRSKRELFIVWAARQRLRDL